MDNCRDDECLALLEKALDDENVDPINLTYSVFKIITEKFSRDQLIGQGGFGEVYKGKLKNGTVVAVKKLHNKIENLENPSKKIEILEKNFQSEIDCLKSVKHENIVRLLGYCAEAEPMVAWYPNERRKVQAEVWHRLFCLEYVSEGNLSQYISEPSSGLTWSERYQIIKGICEGVDYLHCWHKIVHMDLKPQNILLGDGMVPKIADFGLSKRFTEDQSRTITANIAGTRGYMAPEFINNGTITMKADIYSLGVIIIEILTGCRRDWLSIDMVLESWSSTFEKWRNHRSLLVLEEQVKLCATIGMACIDKDSSNRPDIRFINQCLDKMDISNSSSTSSVPSSSCRKVCKGAQLYMFCRHYEQARQACKSMRICGSKLSHSGLSESESLDVYPLELPFPFFQQERKRTQCSLNLTNRTDRYVGYWIFPEFSATCIHDQIAILDPFCTATVCVEMEMPEQPPHTDMILVVMIRKRNKMDLQGLLSFSTNDEETTLASLLRLVGELGGEVHAAMLKAVAVYPPGDGDGQDGVTCQLSSSSLRGKKKGRGGGGEGPPADSCAPMMGGMAMPSPPLPQQQQRPVQGMMMRPPNMVGGGGWQPAGQGTPMMGGMAVPPPPQQQQQPQPGSGMMMRLPSTMGGAGFTGGMGQAQAMSQMGGTPMGHHQHMGGGGNGMQMMQPGGGGAVQSMPAGGGMPGASGFYQGSGGVMPYGPREMMQAAGNPMAMIQAQQQQYTAAQGQQQYMAAQQMNGHGGYPAVGYGYSRPAMQYPQLPSPYVTPAYYYDCDYDSQSYKNPRDNIYSDENPNSWCTVM